MPAKKKNYGKGIKAKFKLKFPKKILLFDKKRKKT